MNVDRLSENTTVRQRPTEGFRHQSSHRVSDGFRESMGFATAILYGDGGPIPQDMIERFDRESERMPPEVRTLILGKLRGYNARRGAR
jgi:hypothetical protein